MNIQNMLSAISKGNHVLTETVQMCQITTVDCPDCGYDPIRKESLNFNCETCHGKGVIETVVSTTIPASLQTKEDFDFIYTQQGKLTEGQIYVTLDVVEVNQLNNSTAYDLTDYKQVEKFVNQYSYITWQGGNYKIEKFETGYLQGILYEIGVTCKLLGED